MSANGNRISIGKKIVDGPSREELFDSLRLGTGEIGFVFEQNALKGSMVKPVKLTGRILGITLEDGSSQSWMLDFLANKIDGRPLKGSTNLRLYFQTTRREGCVI